MSSRHPIQPLLAHSGIWQGRRQAAGSRPVLPTGFPELDAALGGGWPLGEVNELLVPEWGLGEFRLLLPALARLSHAPAPAGWLLFADPPYCPYAPGLRAAGLDLSRLLVLRSNGRKALLWSIEQSLESHCFSAILAFCGAADRVALHRLRLAAAASACWLVLLRSERWHRQRSPAGLRLRLAMAPDGRLRLDILKQRAGRPRRLLLDC